MIIYNSSQIVMVKTGDFNPVQYEMVFRSYKKTFWSETKEGWYMDMVFSALSEQELKDQFNIVIMFGKPMYLPFCTIYYSDGSTKMTVFNTYEEALHQARDISKGFIDPRFES